MNLLADQFRIDGFDFKLIAREGDVALFQKSKPSTPKTFYEVVIVQKEEREHHWPDGRVTPPHERMPSNEQWGTKGWSPATKEDAWKRFRELGRIIL